MKNVLFIAVLLSYCAANAQVNDFPLTTEKKAFILRFDSLRNELKVNIDEDFKDYYSNQIFTDSSLIFRNNKEYNSYKSELKDVENRIKKKKETEEKGKKYTNSKLLFADKSLYLNDRNLLKPGLEIRLIFDEYKKSKRFVVKSIIFITQLEGDDRISGTYESLDGDIAIIDGQGVKLKEGVELIGKKNKDGSKSYEGNKFSRFEQMELGMEVTISGRRQLNGILLGERGEVRPSDFNHNDDVILKTLKNTMKFGLDKSEVSFGEAKYKLINNSTIQAYVSTIGKRTIPRHIKDLPRDHPEYINFNFYVIHDSTFNACAYPDGSVFIHSQLLLEIDNEAQLATILGHEIGHATSKHARKSYEKNKTKSDWLAIGSAVAIAYAGLQSAELVIYAASFGGAALSSMYSRDFERQADRIGLNYMYEAGYNPLEAAKVWEKLFQKNPDLPPVEFMDRLQRKTERPFASIYASHPVAKERFKNLNYLIAKNYQDADLSKLTVGAEEYATFKKRLGRLLKGLDLDEPIKITEQTKPVSRYNASDPKTKNSEKPAKTPVKKPATQKTTPKKP